MMMSTGMELVEPVAAREELAPRHANGNVDAAMLLLEHNAAIGRATTRQATPRVKTRSQLSTRWNLSRR
jgi:hypothetical protein